MTTPVLRVAVWAAVSSKEQAGDDKESIPHQIASGERFAQKAGGEVVARYEVGGHSRDIIFYHDAEQQMDAYRSLREDVEAKRFDVLWCLDVDRIGRDPALAQQVISLVEKGGAEVYMESAPHTIGQKTTAHRYISAIQSVRAGEDQALRKNRHAMGMRGRIKRGWFSSNPPLGYRQAHDDAGRLTGYEFTPDIEIVVTMTDLFLRGFSYAEMRRRLNGAGPRSLYTVRKIMLNDSYAGYPTWGAVRFSGDAGPSDKYPPLWDGATHRAVVQERSRRSIGPYQHRTGGPYSGVAFCARCGGRMSSSRKNNGLQYYRCLTHVRHGMYDETPSCHPNTVPEYRITTAVHLWLRDYSTPERLDEKMAIIQAGAGDEPQLRKELECAERSVARLRRKRDSLADLAIDRVIDAQMYHRKDGALLAQIDEAGSKIDGIRRQLEAVLDVAVVRRMLEEVALNFPVLLIERHPQEVAHDLQAIGIRVLCEDRYVVEVLPRLV